MSGGASRRVAAAAALALLAGCSGAKSPPPANGFDFSRWRGGDVHVHAAGDADLVRHPRCRGDVDQTIAACARTLTRIMAESAQQQGMEWMILTEHVVWLGGVVTYSERKASEQWNALRDAVEAQAGSTRVRLLMGQEQATFQQGGHFNTYFQRDVLHQRTSDFDEVGYIARAARAGAWGAINHPDHARNPWTCWDDFVAATGARAECERRAQRNGHPALAEAFAERWDSPGRSTLRAIEITNNAVPPTAGTLAVWDRLLGRGYVIGATGASDAHTLSRSHVVGKPTEGRIGNSRTYAFVGGSLRAGDGFDATDPSDPVRVALYEGRTVASTGLLAVPEIGGSFPGDTVDAGTSEQLALTIWIKTPPNALAGTMTVAVIPVTGACGGSCKPGRVTRQITAKEWSDGRIPITVRMPADVRRAAVRVEATADAGRLAAWASPIYLERRA